MAKRRFYPYVVQIGSNESILYVNYATDVKEAYYKFLQRHTQIRDSKLRADLYDQEMYFNTTRRAERGCRYHIEELEQAGYEVIAGGPLHNPFWRVYTIEIDGNPKHIYVGQTDYPVEKRYQQHVFKFNPARIFLRHDVFELAMQHAEHLPTYRYKEDSIEAEAALAKELLKKGFAVEGGH